MQSTRSEMFGLWGLITHIRLACEYFDISTTDVTINISCDNKIAIKKCTTDFDGKEGIKEYLTPDYDVEAAIHEALKALSFKPKFTWVKGHQTEELDDDGCIVPLSREAITNNTADEIAGDCLHQQKAGKRAPSESVPHMPAARARRTVKANRITSDIRTEL